MSQPTRKSSRCRFLTSKAKQLETPSTQPIQSKKPVLRSISTIDDNEDTYNNLNFKKRKLQPIADEDLESSEDEEEFTPIFQLAKDLLTNEDDLSDDENIFNSEDDNEYYSAISDYESDNIKVPTKRFINHSKAFQFKKNQDENSRLAKQQQSNFNDNLFDSDSDSDITTPINSNFGTELKSLEENFKKIIDENHKSYKSTVSSPVENSNQVIPNQSLNIDDFVDYTSDVVSSDDDDKNSHQILKPASKLLHYRHNENHNLAFLDTSIFPIRYDPTVKSKKPISPLNKRAILSGMASEMVGTGMTIGEFNIF